MRSLVSVGVSVKCLLNNSRLTARHGGRRRGIEEEEWDVQRGWRGRWQVDVGGWRRRRRGIKDCPAPASCEPEAVGGAQHVFMSWRGPSSLFKKNYTRGVGVWKPHSQENLTKWLSLTNSCFLLITYASVSDSEATRGHEIRLLLLFFFYSFVGSDRDQDVCQNAPRLASFMTNKMRPSSSKQWLSVELWTAFLAVFHKREKTYYIRHV